MVIEPLQPGRREDVQLLGEWLQHSMHRNCHENHDGQFEDAEAAFILHSIAFLEIVRQVNVLLKQLLNMRESEVLELAQVQEHATHKAVKLTFYETYKVLVTKSSSNFLLKCF